MRYTMGGENAILCVHKGEIVYIHICFCVYKDTLEGYTKKSPIVGDRQKGDFSLCIFGGGGIMRLCYLFRNK